MARQYYEFHNYENPSLPILFHYDTIDATKEVQLHWHENVEFLYCVEGQAELNAGGVRTQFGVGDTAIINSNEMHTVRPVSDVCHYYCIIISQELCAENNIDSTKIHFPPVVYEENVADHVNEICEALSWQDEFSFPTAKLHAALLFLTLARRYGQQRSEEWRTASHRKEELAHKLVKYIDAHCTEPLSVRSVCEVLGFSESYVCHTFREVSGQTLTEYINYRRCVHARQLLRSGVCNVSEAAMACGFTNLSYFSKIYREVLGNLPKVDAATGSTGA